MQIPRKVRATPVKRVRKKPRINNYDPTRPDYDYKADTWNRRGWLSRWVTYFSLFDLGYKNNRFSQIALAKSKASGRTGGGFRFLKETSTLKKKRKK